MFEDSPQTKTPDSLMLPGFWYRALPADTVFRERLERATLLETPSRHRARRAGPSLRTARRVSASRHASFLRKVRRYPGGMQLSRLAFRRALRPVPVDSVADRGSETQSRSHLRRQLHMRRTRRLHLGLHSGARHPQAQDFHNAWSRPLGPPRVPTFSEKYKLAYLTSDLPCSVDHGIIGLMDPAHGPFVHQAWWWRSRDSIHEKQKTFEPIDLGFRMSAHTPSSNSAPYKLLKLYADADAITTTIDFTLPNMRWETIRAGKYWFSSLTTVTPITRSRCRIDVVAAWNLFRWFPFGEDLLKYVFGKFVEQDRKTMEQQSEGLEAQPAPDADRRRGSPRQMVLPTQAGVARLPPHRCSLPTPDVRPGHAQVEELSTESSPLRRGQNCVRIRRPVTELQRRHLRKLCLCSLQRFKPPSSFQAPPRRCRSHSNPTACDGPFWGRMACAHFGA